MNKQTCVYNRTGECRNPYKCNRGWSYSKDAVKLCKLGGDLTDIKQAMYHQGDIHTHTSRERYQGKVGFNIKF